jgi:hypothetical protein
MMSGYALFVLLVYCSFVGHTLYCGKPCKESKDCEQAGADREIDCSVCAYADSNTHTDGRNQEKKICMSLLQSCGGQIPPAKNKSLKQYLVIGDPITQRLFHYIENALDTGNYSIEAHLAPGKPKSSADGLRCIKVWVGRDPTRWQVISFNFGIWDIARNGDLKDDNGTYGINLMNITSWLMTSTLAYNGKTKLIFTLTTPTANTSDCCPSQVSGPGIKACLTDIISYNRIATDTLTRYFKGVIIDDLYGRINKRCCGRESCSYDSCAIQPHTAHQCQVYFSAEGWNVLALNVSTTVKNVLNNNILN